MRHANHTRRAQGAALAGALAALLGAAGCQGTYTVTVAFDDDALRSRASGVEVSFVGSCEGLPGDGEAPVDPSVLVEFAAGERSAELGEIAPGPHGVYARVRDDGCTVYAAGCAEVVLEAGGSGELVVHVGPVDGPACEPAERCAEGLCVDGGPDGDADVDTDADADADVECLDADGCDDDNPCTDDVCAGSGCQHVNVAPGTSCEGTLFCRVGETCDDAGRCDATTGTPTSCADAFDCTTDTCSEETDSCASAPDHARCTEAPRLFCAPTSPDADARGCVDLECTLPGDCDDGQMCNGVESCDLSGPVGQCVAGNPPACVDGIACTADGACDPSLAGGAGACSYAPDHEACDDRDACTDDLCDPSAPGADPTTGCRQAEVDCAPDGDPCTVDACTETSGGCYAPVTACDAGVDGCCPPSCTGFDDGDCCGGAVCATVLDGCCPATCDVGDDADCCEASGLCGVDGDACCPAGCTEADDADCCSEPCSFTMDGCCAPTCTITNDSDCCVTRGVCGEADGCCPAMWGSCGPLRDPDCCNYAMCVAAWPNGCCPLACTAATDMDCCDGSCSMTSDGCCPRSCSPETDADCCEAECSTTSDGCCPATCSISNDADCCAAFVCMPIWPDFCCPAGCTASDDPDCD
jgi:hypothetical protein